MFGSPVLEIAIGIVFVYLLLSLVCSALNEMIEAALRNRAKDLEKGIRSVLADENLADKFYDHALIKALCIEKAKMEGGLRGWQPLKWLFDLIDRLRPGSVTLPTYVPSQTFAMALMNIIAPGNIPTNQGTTGAVNPDPLKDLRDKINTFSLPGVDAKAFEPIKQALTSLVDDAQGSVTKFRSNLEGWFDASMDRVSGWYKRRVQIILLILGLGVAIGLNADTTYIVQSLSTDPVLRAKVVAAADEFAAAQKTAKEATSEASANANAQLSDTKKKFDEAVDRVSKSGLPLGWVVDAKDKNLQWPGVRLWESGVRTAWRNQIRFHWLGWMLTAFAISLGAPFWFDMLNKLIVVRSTVKPKEKSGTEPSKS
jgi:hypothetical protein